MKEIRLGSDCKSGDPVRIPVRAFRTHFHLIGGTGKGKTTAIHTMLHPLLMEPLDRACFIIVDRMGNLSNELLLWMASRYCTDSVRRRLVYIEPARENVVLGFNPLLYRTDGEGFYKVQRATDIILRAWESVNIEAMPRLARWTFNAFWAAAQLKLTIADCVHFLMPGSPYHTRLLACLPERLRYEWAELIEARGSEVVRILESTRNRLKPYFESDILRPGRLHHKELFQNNLIN
jgi:Type IV secretion-system coupling protein DNA-binding domain